jgi:uracil-DNA glycosylase
MAVVKKAVLSTAAALIPDTATLPQIREIAKGCQACDLWKKGTQTVFGEGTVKAQLLFVGEQPGNDEDLAGHPFIGPAGKLLDKALEEAEIDRGVTYVTNVVKHFKWEPRGKRRIHAKPNAQEITACLPWLQAEIRLVQPRLVVCLGATAAQALLGRSFRVTQQRGVVIDAPFGAKAMATVHPSSILRAPDPETRKNETQQFTADLKIAAEYLRNTA